MLIFYLIKLMLFFYKFFFIMNKWALLGLSNFTFQVAFVFYLKKKKKTTHNWFESDEERYTYGKNEEDSMEDTLTNSLTILFYLFLFYFFTKLYIISYISSWIGLVLPDYLLELARIFSGENYFDRFIPFQSTTIDFLREKRPEIFLKLNFFLYLFWK